MIYGKLLAEMAGHSVIAAADAEMPLQSPKDFARNIANFATAVKKLADDSRASVEQQKMLLAANAYHVVDGDMKGRPVPRAPVPAFDFKPLDEAVANLKAKADKYEEASARNLSPEQQRKVMAIMRDIDATLLDEAGLPGRPWYKNLIYAPGRYIGYGVTTMPGITEGISEERFGDVPKYINMTAAVLKAYAARLDQATLAMTEK